VFPSFTRSGCFIVRVGTVKSLVTNTPAIYRSSVRWATPFRSSRVRKCRCRQDRIHSQRAYLFVRGKMQQTYTRCSRLTQDAVHLHKTQHTYTRFSTLTQDAAHLHKMQHTYTRCSTLTQDTAHLHKIQHTYTRCSTLIQGFISRNKI